LKENERISLELMKEHKLK